MITQSVRHLGTQHLVIDGQAVEREETHVRAAGSPLREHVFAFRVGETPDYDDAMWVGLLDRVAEAAR